MNYSVSSFGFHRSLRENLGVCLPDTSKYREPARAPAPVHTHTDTPTFCHGSPDCRRTLENSLSVSVRQQSSGRNLTLDPDFDLDLAEQ